MHTFVIKDSELHRKLRAVRDRTGIKLYMLVTTILSRWIAEYEEENNIKL